MATISRRLAGPSYLPHLRREDGDDERGGLPYPFSGSASTGGDPRQAGIFWLVLLVLVALLMRFLPSVWAPF